MIQIYQESVPFTNKRVDSPASQSTFLNPIIMPFALNTTLGSNVLETVLYIKNNSVEHFYKDVVISLMKEDSNLDSQLTNGVISQDKSKFSLNSYRNIPVTIAYGSTSPSGSNWNPKVLDGQYKHNYVPVTDSYLIDTFVGNTTVLSDTISSMSPSEANISVGLKITGLNIPDNTVVTDFDSELGTVTLNNLVLANMTSAEFTLSKKTDDNIKVKFSYGYDQISDYDWGKLSSVLVIPSVGNSTTPDTSYIPIRIRIEWLTPQSIYTIRDYFLDVSYSEEGNVI